MEFCSEKKSILLHSCCGPCSAAVVERLSSDHKITVFYFNPNITDKEEYIQRLEEQKRFLEDFENHTGVHTDFIEGEYDPCVFFECVKGLEKAPEGGERCAECFLLRLQKTAELAEKLGFDCFDTTLTVSPYKNYDVINGIGKNLEKKYGVLFEGGNYKKKNGYRRSVEMSAEYGLYRQNYCGCIFSKIESEEHRRRRAAEKEQEGRISGKLSDASASVPSIGITASPGSAGAKIGITASSGSAAALASASSDAPDVLQSENNTQSKVGGQS